MADRVEIDVQVPVTAEEAVELMLHHLSLAAAYYEATPDDRNAQALAEAERVMLQGPYTPPMLAGARAWLAAMLAEYDEKRERD